MRRYFRGDAAFAAPDIYEFLEDEGFLYVIRLKANKVLQECIAHLLTCPVGRPPNHVRLFHASFSYQAGSWNKKSRVIAMVEWHPGELYHRVGLIVTKRPTAGKTGHKTIDLEALIEDDQIQTARLPKGAKTMTLPS